MPKSANQSIAQRVHDLDWDALTDSLFTHGFAMTEPVLSPLQCRNIAAMFNQDERFRKIVNMAQHRFGSGIYKYFKYPLPEHVTELRTATYEYLAPIANAFNEALDRPEHYPSSHEQFLKVCHKAGQTRPTPLVLHYEEGDFNCLHQDLYGELAFPLQITAFLSERETDYTGGEFVLQEQMPRAQSRVHVIKPEQGQLVIFATTYRPERTARGFRKVNMKHGVATVRTGKRDTLGIIFHDAK
jgi:hypothetical protein